MQKNAKDTRQVCEMSYRPAAVCLCFVAATSVQHHQVVPGQDLLAVGVSCLKTCGEGGALFEDSQANRLEQSPVHIIASNR